MKMPRLPRRAAARRIGAPRRWAVWGALCGAALAVPSFAPAAWLAGWVQSASEGHLLLADARGSVWSGSAVAVLGGGSGSQDARALPGRLQWTLRPGLEQSAPAMILKLEQACCLSGHPTLSLQPGLGRLTLRLQPGADRRAPPGPSVDAAYTPGAPGAPLQTDIPGEAGTPREIGHWPAGWLAGLGTPWNTLQLGGVLRLSTSGMALERTQGRWRVEGAATLELQDASSRVSTLARLGSYRLELASNPAQPGAAALKLQTLDGALRLSGSGTVAAGGLRFRGEATAAGGEQPALANLLNIIGRRDGARSVIEIG